MIADNEVRLVRDTLALKLANIEDLTQRLNIAKREAVELNQNFRQHEQLEIFLREVNSKCTVLNL